MVKVAGPQRPGGAGGPVGEAAGMDRADLKRMLRFASQEPVQVAFALGGDGKAIIVLDRRKPARALEKELKIAAPDSKTHRFGSASVDPEQPKLARFMVNKAAGGIARKLVVALKGTGFSKVEVGSEDGGAPERAEGDDEDAGHQAPDTAGEQAHGAAAASAGNGGASADQAAHGGGGPAPPQSAPPHAAEAPAAPPNATPSHATLPSPSQAGATAAGAAAANLAAAPGAPPDTGQLVAKLVPLVQRIQAASAANPAQKAPLHKLATDAQASLRRAMLTLAREDLDRAASDIQLVRKGVEAAERPPAQAGTPGPGGPKVAPHGSKPGDGHASAAGQPNAAQVTAALSAAVKRAAPVMRADPSMRDALQHQITQAHASLKAGNLDEAQGFIVGLQGQLGPFGSIGPAQVEWMQGSGGTAGDTASGVAVGHASAQAATGAHQPDPLLAKAAQVWDATCNKVRSELHRVEGAFVAAVKGHGVGDQLSKAFNDLVQPVHHALDGTLARKLHEVSGAKDHAARAKAAGEAKVMIAVHRKSIAEHPVLHAIESNPLVPVLLRKLIHAGLDTADKVLGKHLAVPGGGPAGTAAGSLGGAGGRAAGSARGGDQA